MLDSSAAATLARPACAHDDGHVAFYPATSPHRSAAHRAPVGLSLPLSASDRELGQAFIDGRPEALAAAWRRFYPVVQRMLRRAVGQGDLDDLVQDVFFCLFRRAHALREPDALRPFVIGIARHTAYRERRRRMRRERLALECARTVDRSGVGSGPATSYASLKLAKLLQRLTEQERASFVLRFSHGMTVPEVAGALRVSEPTAKRRLSRARACLGTWVQKDPFLLGYVQGKSAGLLTGAD